MSEASEMPGPADRYVAAAATRVGLMASETCIIDRQGNVPTKDGGGGLDPPVSCIEHARKALQFYFESPSRFRQTAYGTFKRLESFDFKMPDGGLAFGIISRFPTVIDAIEKAGRAAGPFPPFQVIRDCAYSTGGYRSDMQASSRRATDGVRPAPAPPSADTAALGRKARSGK